MFSLAVRIARQIRVTQACFLAVNVPASIPMNDRILRRHPIVAILSRNHEALRTPVSVSLIGRFCAKCDALLLDHLFVVIAENRLDQTGNW